MTPEIYAGLPTIETLKVRKKMFYTNDFNSNVDSLEKLMEAVSHFYGVRKESIKSKGRLKEYTHPRMVFVYLARNMFDISWVNLGKYVNRDHATCIHYIKKINDWLFYDDELEKELATIKGIYNEL